MQGISVGYAMCGSFCTLRRAVEQLRALKSAGAKVTPIMSRTAYATDTRFGAAADIRAEIEEICGEPIIRTIKAAEPIGPNAPFDLLIVAPCTGNTAAKLALGITDTPVTMAVKAHLRNERPVLLAVATNDALGAAAKNIGQLLNLRNIFFVPFSQDDPEKKPRSMIADFSLIPAAARAALSGSQLEPIVR